MTTSATDKPYAVNYWGSHPEAGNDDCWTGEDFATLAEAEAAFAKTVTDPYCDTDTAYIEMVGPGVDKIRKNPDYNEARAKAEAEADAKAWQREIAMEAGMAFGCDGYNDAMGY